MTYYERNLPHWHPEGKRLFVTWRLYGSLPAKLFDELRKNNDLSDGKKFVTYDRHLDFGGCGPLWLKDERIARVVVEVILNAQANGSCKVLAYVVMPNHVHLLLEPHKELAKITQLIKGRTARAANAILNRTCKPFWQDESFDHWVRNATKCERVRRYIEDNPVKAGLVKGAADWLWSSAGEHTCTD